jgi:uncharacterized repeat protein (TIGR03803 family)
LEWSPFFIQIDGGSKEFNMTRPHNTRSWAAGLATTILMILAMAITASAQFTTLVSFTGTNGDGPFQENLVQGVDGNLYGTTTYGGTHSDGTIFKITPGGALTTIYNFANTPDGANPYTGLVLGTNGKFYGTTAEGGASGLGTVFTVTTKGVVSILHSFSGMDGEIPYGALIEGADGNYYGTTQFGGTMGSGYGTVFKITSTGTFTSLHSFDDTTDGYEPFAGLVQGSNGDFFGTTAGGPGSNFGTVFKITSKGVYTLLHTFIDSDGWEPEGVLFQASSGKFFGTTVRGGADGLGEVFTITLAGTFDLLHSFTSVSDGYEPTAGLIQGSDGNFYGTSTGGGTFGEGNIIEVTSGGTVTTLHSFSGGDGGPDGDMPFGGLVQHTSGVLFGTTGGVGSGGTGTVFSLNQGLKAFVKAVPNSGKVGATVTILGTSIGSATEVEFGSVKATITKNTATSITTTVPAGATTGKVKVFSPGCTCSTLVSFIVR